MITRFLSVFFSSLYYPPDQKDVLFLSPDLNPVTTRTEKSFPLTAYTQKKKFFKKLNVRWPSTCPIQLNVIALMYLPMGRLHEENRKRGKRENNHAFPY